MSSTTDVNSRVRALLGTARKHKAATVQVWRQAQGTTGEPDLVHAAPLEAGDAFADRICSVIFDECEELAGRHVFLVRAKDAEGLEIAAERLKVEGRAQRTDVVVRSEQDRRVDPLRSPPGQGPAQNYDAADLVLPDGALTGTATTAVCMALLKQQMRFTESLARIVTDLSGKSHEPLVRQTEVLGNALASATEKLTSSAAAHVELVRQTRVLEVEARIDERKAEAWAKAGEQLAKYLPAAIARISRKFGAVAEDEENDPLLEKLVGSFKPEQLAAMQQILGPEQIALFAEVWASMDERKAKRGGKGKATKKDAASSSSSSSSRSLPANGAANGANGAHT